MNTSNTPYLLALIAVVIAIICGLIFSPSNALQIIGFGGFITLNLVQIIKQNAGLRKQDEAAIEIVEAKEKIATVAVDLRETSAEQKEHLSRIENTGEKVHELVNSKMGAQLKIAADLARQVVNLTVKPEDKASAEKIAVWAEELLHEHEIKQAVVDRKEQAEATIFPK